jgi:hypothetical protein
MRSVTNLQMGQSLLQMAFSTFGKPYSWHPIAKNIVRRGLVAFVVLAYTVPLLLVTSGLLFIIGAGEQIIYLLLIITAIVLSLICYILM